MAGTGEGKGKESPSETPRGSSTSNVVIIIVISLITLYLLIEAPYVVFIFAAVAIYFVCWSDFCTFICSKAPALSQMPSGCLVLVVGVALLLGYQGVTAFYFGPVTAWIGPEAAYNLWHVVSDEQASVSKVIHGDTLEVLLNGRSETVAVWPIDAPDAVDSASGTPECFGVESEHAARQMLEGRTVSLSGLPTGGDHDRSQRAVRIDGRDFGIFMLRNGFAKLVGGYREGSTYQDSYQNAEIEARNKGLGVWSSSCQ